jgi:hypothetical protein
VHLIECIEDVNSLSTIIRIREVCARWHTAANYLASEDLRLMYLSPCEDMNRRSEGGKLLNDLESDAISASSDEYRGFTEILG